MRPLHEIPILLTKNRFVAVLEKMSMSVMTPVEPHRVTGQKPAHDRCDRNRSGAKQQVHVIGHQRPCVTGRSLLLQKSTQPLKKILPIFVIPENPFPLNPSDNNMVQGAGGVYASLARHGLKIPFSRLLVDKETTSRCARSLISSSWTASSFSWQENLCSPPHVFPV